MKKSFSQSAEHLLSAKEKGTEIRDRTRNAIPMECCMDIKERQGNFGRDFMSEQNCLAGVAQ